MKITDKHPEYLARIEQWERCRDAISGGDSIKAKGERYLDRLPGQSDKEYGAYKKRALWYNATARTLDGMTGLVFGVAPAIDRPSGSDVLVDDCDMMGRPFTALAEDALEEVVGIGRYCVMVDHPVMLPGLTVDEAEKGGFRPYCVSIDAENVTNWEYARIDNRWKLARVVYISGLDEKRDPEFRELLLDAGIYHVRSWKKTKGKDDYEIISDDIPLMKGAPLATLPFFFLGPEFGDPDPDQPPLLDLVDVNLSHYRTMADLEHGRFFCGLPTPVFAGFTFDDGQTVKLGGLGGISSPLADAKAYYLEFQGQGLEALERASAQKEAMMAKLGARMLSEDKKAAEAAETMRIRSSGESSVLASIAQSVSMTMSMVLSLLCEWSGLSADNVSVQLNTDYSPANLTAQDLTALLAAVQAGELPRLDYFRALKRGGIIGQDRSFEDYESETPVPGTGFDGGDTGVPQ